MYHTSFYANQNAGIAAAFAVIIAFLGVGLSGIVNLVFRPNKDI